MAPLMDDDNANVGRLGHGKGDFTTTIGYTLPPSDGVNLDMNELSLEKPQYREIRQVKLHDVRGAQQDFTLDEHGFQYYKLADVPGEGEVEFTNNEDPKIKKIHYKGMEKWLLRELGAREVIIYNHIVRNEIWQPHLYSTAYRGPAMRPHIDVSHAYAPKMLKRVWEALGRDSDELQTILAARAWQAINIWRPLKTIKRDPLAVLDTRSASPDDFFRNTHKTDGGEEVETCWLTSGLQPGDPDNMSKHKWYYMHEQQSDELVLFKMFDARPGATSNGTSHTAVHVPGTEGEPARNSIEMRAFVFY